MLKIRLQRIGRKHEPVFRLVLTDSKNSTKSGRFLEVLGNFDARHGEKAVVNAERVSYWISAGAQATGTVHNLLVSRKIVTGKKVNVLPKKKAIIKEGAAVEAAAPVSAPIAAPAPAEEAPVETSPEAPAEETPTEVAA